jgi:hypothetical protein
MWEPPHRVEGLVVAQMPQNRVHGDGGGWSLRPGAVSEKVRSGFPPATDSNFLEAVTFFESGSIRSRLIAI